MSNIIDISARITNQLPVVKITDDIVVTVNNRKSTILNVQCMVKEQERKAKADTEEKGEYDELAFMNKVLSMLVGEKNVNAIDELDLPFPEYKIVYESLMGAATGSLGDTPSK